MQNNVFLKLGMAALLSVMMAACSSTDTEDGPATTATTGNNAASTGAGNNAALTAEEQRRQRALATTVFYFEFDKSDLTQEARDALVYHAEQLKSNPNMRIRLEGHADERGCSQELPAAAERVDQVGDLNRERQVLGVRCSDEDDFAI